MRIPKITPEIVVALLLFVAIVANTISHVSSPAYKYYRDNLSAIRQDCKRFESKITNDLIPFMAYAITNTPNIVSGNSAVSGNTRPTDSTSGPLTLNFRFFLAGGKAYAEISGRYYTQGDTLLGEPIIALDATCITTPKRMYVAQSFVGQSQDRSNRTKIENKIGDEK